jgi:stress response protein SCP2
MSTVVLKDAAPQQLVLKSQLPSGQQAPLKELLAILSWTSGPSKDLDLSVMFRKVGETLFPEGGVDPNSVLYYASKTALNGNARLSDDNQTGANVDVAKTLASLKIDQSVISKLSHLEVDEACWINLDAITPTHSEAYLSVLDYNNNTFGEAEEVSISFYDAKTGDQVGETWAYNDCLQGDGSGFIVAKITKNGDAWTVSSLSQPVKDEDGNGHLTFNDANVVINKKGI